jgi:uncharacterized protein (TIGR02996 family)
VIDRRELLKSLGVKGAKFDDPAIPYDLAIDALDFARVADALFAKWDIRTLRLWKATGADFEAALARPELARIERLSLFRNRLTDADLTALVEAPHLARVAALDFVYCGLTGRAASILAAADPRRLPALRELDLGANRIGAVGVKALAGSALARQLTNLNLFANHGGDDAIARLLASPAIANLESLNVERNEAGAKARDALEATPHALRLVELVGMRSAAPLLARNRKAKRPWVAPTPPPTTKPRIGATRDPADAARGAALLASFLADPSDAATRAVYADWLESQGDPRGTLVALETRLADADDDKLEREAARLRKRLLRDFAQRFKNKSAIVELEYGFAVHVGGPLQWFLERGAEILAAEPVRSVRFDPASESGLRAVPEIAGIERLAWITIAKATPKLLAAVPFEKLGASIELAGIGAPRRSGSAMLAEMLAMPQIRRVRGLDFWDSPTLDELRELSRDPQLAQLTRVAFDYSGPEADRAAKLILDSPWKLERVDIGRVGDRMVRELCARYGDDAVIVVDQ